MTILTLNRAEFEKKVGRVDEKLEKLITDMGTPIEYVTDLEVAVEVFPNRPDLLSLENFSRAVLQFKGKGRIADFKILAPEKGYEVIVEKSVKGVRNHTVCCIIRGLQLNDSKIAQIIDMQEKLHNSIGRKRKKVAIGIYPMDKISMPITFKAVDPATVTFKPLEFPKEITAKQILTQHPTGKMYAHLLADKNLFPFFFDAEGKVLSLPPIINSEETGRVSVDTKDVFIECSGDNLHYLDKVLAIIVASFSEMGGKVYGVTVRDKKTGTRVTPDMSPAKVAFTTEYINIYLGMEFSEKEIGKLLARMGIGYEKNKKSGDLLALIPAYRTDILHKVDLVEEVAIAYGYDNFDAIIPAISTIASEHPMSVLKRTIGKVLDTAELLQVSSFHLTTKKNVRKTYFEFNDFIELEDSKTERDVVRYDLLTNLLQIFSDSSDAAYPQKIYELGRVFGNDESEESETGILETERLCVAMVDAQISYTDVKQIFDYLCSMLSVEYSIVADDHPAYIEGRCGKIIVGGRDVGFIGEINPRVLYNWKIKVPGAAFEIDTDAFV
ncbi:MAG: phenylalanyl-tRNA synthetase beta chain [Patescibacteria group bacterium]|jgi:phenylalanyl-tRNA synthetase beta chain